MGPRFRVDDKDGEMADALRGPSRHKKAGKRMTFGQAAALAILGAMIVLFVWNRLRYDLVALLGLIVAVGVGIVPPEKAFDGFRDQIVIIVASALILSAAISRSGVVQAWLRPVTPLMPTAGAQITVLGTIVAILSAFTKNIGALATFLPVAISMSRKSGHSPSRVLMPLSFAALLGGLITLIGTSPNIVVSRLRQELVGQPFAMFDFAPVGIGITLLGLVFLAFGWRLLPEKAAVRPERPFEIADYATEVRVRPNARIAGKTVADLERMADGEIAVVALIRADGQRYVPAANWQLDAGDLLLLQADPEHLKRLTEEAGLEFAGSRKPEPADDKAGEIVVIEAVVTPESSFVNRALPYLRLRQRHSVNVLALSRSGEMIRERLNRIRFQPGDVVVLEGREDDVLAAMTATNLLPLAERKLQLGRGRRKYLAVGILAVGMGLAVSRVVPTEIAFFGAAVLVVATGALPIKDAYESIDWPLIMLLAGLIPVSDALRTTGVTDLVASGLSFAARGMPAYAAVLLIMVAAMLVTPFLNNAATVLVLAPIAAGLAQNLGLRPDAFLMAVAVGAGSDFLTPIGHQCNTLVMGPGGYSFGDYWRLGLPLSILVALVGTALIMMVWPLR
jgi:di/tricarboxylate transporter